MEQWNHNSAIVAVKDGRVIAKGSFSRNLAEQVKAITDTDTSTETIARSIRKRIDKNKPYLGFTYIRI